MARLSLAQQIAELEAPAPIDVDPEAIIDSQENADTGASRAHYVEVGRSTLRRLHDSAADPKYDGIKVSRQQLMQEDEDGDDADDVLSEDNDIGSDGEEESEGWHNRAPSESDEEGEDEGLSTGESDGDKAGEEDDATYTDLFPQSTHRAKAKDVEELTSTLRKNQDEDRKKGIAVSRQIEIWDSLLDARIQLQKAVVSANTLPCKSHISSANSSEYQESLKRMLEEATCLSEELFELQETLLESNESVTAPVRKRRKIEDEDPISSYESYLQETSLAALQLEEAYHPYLVQTLSKWSSKIQAVAPSVLLPSNRNAFSKDRQRIKSAVQLVDENLADRDKLLLRTQTWRGKGTRLGIVAHEDVEKEEDPEIFDDTDFYQQMLRDVIDARNMSGANDWMTVQKQKKAKKKVDTKASKGRKLRYEVHEKLQNFMAPIHIKGAWHEEQVDELFASILGKGFEDALSAQVDDVFTSTDNPTEDLSGNTLEGFRVFG